MARALLAEALESQLDVLRESLAQDILEGLRTEIRSRITPDLGFLPVEVIAKEFKIQPQTFLRNWVPRFGLTKYGTSRHVLICPKELKEALARNPVSADEENIDAEDFAAEFLGKDK